MLSKYTCQDSKIQPQNVLFCVLRAMQRTRVAWSKQCIYTIELLVFHCSAAVRREMFSKSFSLRVRVSHSSRFTNLDLRI